MSVVILGACPFGYLRQHHPDHPEVRTEQVEGGQPQQASCLKRTLHTTKKV